MTNNDDLALKLKAAAEIIGSEKWHTEGSNVWNHEHEVNGEYSSDLIACCENVNNESVHADFIATASPANILALLAERDADKKRIAELEALIVEQDKRLITYAAIATKNASEARTVSVKLPERCECCYSEQEAALFDGIVEEYTEALKTACAEAGIKLDVGE